MKNVFFVLAFMLIGSASYAGNSENFIYKVNSGNELFGSCSYTISVTTFYSTGPVTVSYSYSRYASSRTQCRLMAREDAMLLSMQSQEVSDLEELPMEDERIPINSTLTLD